MNALPIGTKLFAVLLVLVVVGAMGYRAGRHTAEGEQAERDIVSAREYSKNLTEIEAKYRATEQRHTELLAGIAASHQEELAKHDAAAQKTIADIRSGALRMRVPACPAATGDGAVSSASSTTSSSDGESTGDFFKRLYADLATRLSRCDAAAVTLDLAQQVIISDRK